MLARTPPQSSLGIVIHVSSGRANGSIQCQYIIIVERTGGEGLAGIDTDGSIHRVARHGARIHVKLPSGPLAA